MTGDELPKDAFDELLGAALRGRAELTSRIDLAGAALARAQAYQANDLRLARLARITGWARVATFAAAALIALTVAVGYRFLPAANAVAETAADTTATTTTSSTTFDLTSVGIAAFIITLIVVALATLFTPDRPQLRLTPT